MGIAGRAAATPPADLDVYRWKKRVVLVFAPTSVDPRLAAQRQAVKAIAGPADDRDLALVEVVGARATPEGLGGRTPRRRFHVAPGAFRVLLIGKDGGVKLDDSAVLSAARLAATIDAMPMRREEMARRPPKP